MQVSKTLIKQSKAHGRRAPLLAQSQQSTAAFSEQPVQKPQISMMGEETKHRVKLPLYDLMPRIENCWVAPNSTIGKYLYIKNTSHNNFLFFHFSR